MVEGRDVHAELVALGAEVVAVTGEVTTLATAYEQRAILAARYRFDMLHIALATVAESDVLASWNFRHVVRLDKIRAYNAVNLESGYKVLAIYSPREVLGDDETTD